MGRIIKFILWLIIITICCIGAFIQINEVSNRYFHYGTKTTVSVDIPSDIPFPILSTCWRFNDILDMDAIESDRGMRLKRWNDQGFDWHEFLVSVRNFTVADWFKYTPKIENVLERDIGCRIRLRDQLTTMNLDREKCMEYFNVSKYIFTEYMCYRFDPTIDGLMQMYQYTMIPSYSGLIYGLFFDLKSFSHVKKVSQSIHSDSSSYMLDSVLSKSREKTTLALPSSDITYRQFFRIKKEPPYVPRCSMATNKFGTEREGHFIMVDKIFRTRYNMITPFVKTYDDGSNLTMPSYIDFENSTFRTILYNVFSEVGYLERACKFEFYVSWLVLHDDKELSAAIFWPSSETTMILYVPDQELIDFIVYICSCIGIWFGLSVYSTYDAILSVQSLVSKKNRVANGCQCSRSRCLSCHRQHQRMNLRISLVLNYVNQLHNLINNQ